MTDYIRLSKAQLIEEIERLQGKTALEYASNEMRLLQDLKIHQIALEMQNHELREARQALEVARDRYIDLYDFAPVGYLTLCEDGLIHEINLTGATMLGQSRANLINTPFSNYLDQGDRQHFSEYLHQASPSSGNLITEVKLRHSQKDIRLENTSMAATSGQPRHCRMAITDITEEKNTRRALQESEHRWKFALEGAGDGVWDWNLQTGEVLISKRGTEMLGYAENEIENRFDKWASLVHPDDTPEMLANLHAYLNDEAPNYTSEFRLKCKNDGWKWILSRGMTVSRDTDGKPLRMIGTHADISKIRLLTERLQQSHDLLVDLSEQVPGFVHQYQLFPDGRSCFPFAGAGIRNVFELTPSQVRDDASPVFARVHPDDRDGLIASLLESARTLRPCQHEFRVVLPKQGVCWRLSGARPERLDDGSTLWHGFVIDIDIVREARQKTQDLLLQNRLIIRSMFEIQEKESRHLARELHDDLGQWLTAIQAEATAILSLADNGQNPAIHDSAQAISNSATEVHKSIRAMLHRLRPCMLDDHNLADSLHELIAQWRKRHPGIACKLLLGGDFTDLSERSNTTIYRIVQEALTNITRHAQASQVSVALRHTGDEPSVGAALLLTIEDDGIGMDTGLAVNGLGLLGMRERVVAVKNGSIKLHSSPGQGTRIEIRLPREKSGQKNHGH
ncbi:MAG: PAS domain-containing protein [Betaproteobacteria bacterium]|nr:PAS domain-containing protein [Betaproteobacteria bacterium]